MFKWMLAFWAVMGTGTFVLFNGLVNGMSGLETSIAKILS